MPRKLGSVPVSVALVAGICLAQAPDSAELVDTSIPHRKALAVPVVISWVGDIYLAGSVAWLARLRGMDYVLGDVADTLKADSLTVGNLECSVSTTGKPEKWKQYTFQAPPALLDGLKSNGVDMVSLANNHMLDYGKEALVEMVGHLRDAGILFGGAGVDTDSAGAPASATIAGRKVAVVCFSRVVPTGHWYAGEDSPGVAGAYDPERLLQSIARGRDSGATVAVYLHWGKEKQSSPEPYQRVLAHQCIEAGASLVVGSHPHVVQGFEYYRGRLIAYSLGNFIFSNRDNRPSMILETEFVGDSLTSARVIPCRVPELRPVIVRDETERREAFRYLSSLCTNAGVDSTGLLHPVLP